MARAITQIDKKTPNPAEEREQAVGDIIGAISESREAIIVFLDIVKELHAAGILDIVQGLLKTRHQVGVIAINKINEPGMHRVIKNGMNAFQLLSKLDPEQLKVLMNGISAGLGKMSAPDKTHKIDGMWGMVKALRDPEINASIGTLIRFMQGMGQELNKDRGPLH